MTTLHRQPDDPGTAHRDSIDGPVRFIPQAFGREIAAIGSNPVGSIELQNWGRLHRATWCCFLFDGAISSRADTADKAKAALLRKIADWHDLAGTLYAEHARLIRLQAEEIG